MIQSIKSGGREDTLRTGFPSLDVLMGGGIRSGDLVVLGGDTGSGKSSMALSIAATTASDAGRTYFYSSEMRPERVRERLAAMRAGISIADLRSARSQDPGEDDDSPVHPESDSSSSLQLRIMPAAKATDVIAKEIEAHGDAQLVVVDHLQAMASGQLSRAEEQAAVVGNLKALALQTNTAVLLVAFCSPNRSHSHVARPSLPDFGALGAVAENADVALALFREEMYDDARGIDGAAELHVLKNRHGGLGYVDLYFHKKWLRFEDMIDP